MIANAKYVHTITRKEIEVQLSVDELREAARLYVIQMYKPDSAGATFKVVDVIIVGVPTTRPSACVVTVTEDRVTEINRQG